MTPERRGSLACLVSESHLVDAVLSGGEERTVLLPMTLLEVETREQWVSENLLA